MSNRNWTKHKRRERMARNGTEERDTGANLPPVVGARRAPMVSKEELRRQADRLLAEYSGPVTKVPAGSHVIDHKVKLSGSAARSMTARSDSKKFSAAGKSRKSKGRRPQNDLFGAARKNVRGPDSYSRAVPPGLVIYCDGACEPNPGAGGWGFVVYRDGVEIHSDCGGANPTTNQRMELIAAIEAMKWTATNCLTAEAMPRLFSDSMYTVNGSNDWRHSWKNRGWKRKGKNPEIANLDLWQELDRLLVGAPIELEWCKGHAGIIGNERADELSLMGREATLEEGALPSTMDLIREQLDYSARGDW